MKTMKMYPVNQSPLYKLRNKRKLSKILGLPEDTFKKKVDFEYQYKDKQIDKKRGNGKRNISYPVGKKCS